MDNIPLDIFNEFVSQFYLDFVLKRLLMGCHELHVRPFALNIALQISTQLNKVEEKQRRPHLTEDNDCLSAVSDTAEDLTWDALTHVPVPRMNTHL